MPDTNLSPPRNGHGDRPDQRRRNLLKVATLGSAGFAIGIFNPSSTESTEAAENDSNQHPIDMNHFVRVGSDNTVTVIIKHLEMGQGVNTGLAAIVAEEMDAAWEQIDTEFAPADPSRYKNLMSTNKQATGGSSSLANSWTQLREAGAGARALLVLAAAQRWGVGTQDIDVRSGRVSHGDYSASFGELAAAAGLLTPPSSLTLKSPVNFSLIGTTLPRKDSEAKTNGSAKFGSDLYLPNMQFAVVARPPRFGAVLKSMNSLEAAAMPGVTRIVEIPRGVAVLADSYFSAIKGRNVLILEWDHSNAEMRGTRELEAEYNGLLDKQGSTSREEGDIQQAFKTAANTVEADFHFPFLAHAAMEPLNCIVELSKQRCDVWTGSQQPSVDQAMVAEITGLALGQVTINTVLAGGSFGRRSPADSDFVAEAASIAKAVDGEFPIKLQWSREDDMRGGRYRPMAAHRLRASLSEDKQLTGWNQRVVSQSILKGAGAERFIRNGIDPTAVEGSQQLPYAINNFHLDLNMVDSGIPVLWWRSVGHSHNAYATEVFFDMIAKACERDPYELRRELLVGHDRLLGVLDLVAEAAQWGKPVGEGRGRGIALHKSFATYVAQVADVSVSADGRLRLDRVTCAVDCGIAVTPDVIRAQMEGGIGYGLSAALREKITLTDGMVDQSNFHDYQPIRMNEMPEIDVHIVKSAEPPSGVGEPGLPPAAAAVANAIADATGKYLTRLPWGTQISLL